MSRVSRAQRRVAFASPLELYIRTPTDSTACVSRVACEEKLSLCVHACSSSQFTLHTPASRPCAPPYAQPVALRDAQSSQGQAHSEGSAH